MPSEILNQLRLLVALAHLRVQEMPDDGEDVVACPLDASGRDGGLGVVLGVVDVAVLHVGDVQPRDVTVVTEDPEVGVAGDDARLEDLLRPQNGFKFS